MVGHDRPQWRDRLVDVMNSADPTLLYGGNASFVEGLYEDYLADPSAVEPEWRQYFDRLRGSSNGTETAHNGADRAQLVAKRDALLDLARNLA